MLEKIRESAQSVLPIGLIVLLLHFFITPMPAGTLMLFITGIILLILGMSIFTLGARPGDDAHGRIDRFKIN